MNHVGVVSDPNAPVQIDVSDISGTRAKATGSKEDGPGLVEFLNIPNIARLPSSSDPISVRVHPVYPPDEATLDRLSTLIESTKSVINHEEDGSLQTSDGARSIANVRNVGDLVTFMTLGTRRGGSEEKAWKRAIALSVLSGLYSEAEWNFRLAGRHALAEAALDARRRIINETQPLLQTISSGMRNGPDPAIDPWMLTYLGPAGDDIIARWIDACPSAKKPMHSFGVLLAKESTRQMALDIAPRLNIGDRARAFKSMAGALEMAEAEGQEETLRAYDAFISVIARVGTIENPKNYGTDLIVNLGAGESSMFMGTGMKVVDIMTENGRAAILELAHIGGDRSRGKFREGEEKEMIFGRDPSSGPNKIAVKLLSISEGGGKTARFRIRSGNRIEGSEHIKPAGSQQKIAIMGRLNIEETLNAPPVKIKLLGFGTVMADGTPVALLEIKTQSGRTILDTTAAKEREVGRDRDPELPNGLIRIRARNFDQGGAVIEVLSGGPGEDHAETFHSLMEKVARACDERGLDEDWKAALTVACSEWVGENRKDGIGSETRFVNDLAEWAEKNLDTLNRLNAIDWDHGLGGMLPNDLPDLPDADRQIPGHEKHVHR